MWLSFLGSVTFLAFALSVVTGALLGCVLASAARVPLWVGGIVGGIPLVGGLALVVFGVIAVVRWSEGRRTGVWAEPRGWASRIRQPGGRVALLVLAGLMLGAIVSLFLDWLVLKTSFFPVFALGVLGTGADALIIVTVAALLGAGLLALRGPSYWASIIAICVGGAWAFVSASVLALLIPLNRVITDARAGAGTVGDLLSGLGINPDAPSVVLPEWTAVFTGGEALSIDLTSVDVNAILPEVSLRAGSGFYVAAAVGVLCLAWAVAELRAAHRARGLRVGVTGPA